MILYIILVIIFIGLLLYKPKQDIKKKPEISISKAEKVVINKDDPDSLLLEYYILSSVNKIRVIMTINTGAGFEESKINEINVNWGGSRFTITDVKNFSTYNNVVLNAEDVVSDQTNIIQVLNNTNVIINFGTFSETISLGDNFITRDDLDILINPGDIVRQEIEAEIVGDVTYDINVDPDAKKVYILRSEEMIQNGTFTLIRLSYVDDNTVKIVPLEADQNYPYYSLTTPKWRELVERNGVLSGTNYIIQKQGDIIFFVNACDSNKILYIETEVGDEDRAAPILISRSEMFKSRDKYTKGRLIMIPLNISGLKNNQNIINAL